MEVGDDWWFGECEVWGFVWVLGDGVEGGVGIVFKEDGEVVDGVWVGKWEMRVRWGVVGCLGGERVLEWLGGMVWCSVEGWWVWV